MRLFVALEPNTKIIASLTELVRRLAPMAPVRWVHPRNMHVTLKYIGEWDQSRLHQVIDALSRVRITSKVTVPLAGLRFYPYEHTPRVFWAIAENTLPLRQLASSIDTSLARLGIAPEVKPYLPHLTLGRLHGRVDLTEMHEAIEELPSREFGTIKPDTFALYGSMLTPEGPVHKKIDDFPFMVPVSKDIEPELALRY